MIPRLIFRSEVVSLAVHSILLLGITACVHAADLLSLNTNLPPPVPRGFVFGVSQGSETALPWLQRLGVQWTRVNVGWKHLTPTVIEPSLHLDEVRGNFERVRQLSSKIDWTPVDERLRSVLRCGIRSIVIVGHGYNSNYAGLNGHPAYPDRIGREQYLAQMYWTVRAVVERYDGDGIDDAPGIVIKIWQTENELNEAGWTAAWGWRQPVWLDGLRSAWSDWNFLTRLLQTLHQAVKDADPEALTLMNFHTDLPAWMSRLAGERGWLQAVREWSPYMDIIGMDAYPNYFDPLPVAGEAVGKRVALIKTVSNKPVYIIETDYPTGPAILGFLPENQAQFVRDSYQSARAAGAEGYFKFSVVSSPESHKVTITEADVARVHWIRPCLKNRRWIRLIGWALTHTDYIHSHFLAVLQAVEGYWGVVTPDGNPNPAFEELRLISDAIPKS